jgi:co-chaperonin GroES (HSP10)
MKIQPVNNYILIKKTKEEEIRNIIVNEEKQKTQGEIISIGYGEEIQKLGLKVGDNVLYRGWTAEKIESEEDTWIISADSILAIIN